MTVCELSRVAGHGTSVARNGGGRVNYRFCVRCRSR